MRAGDPAAFGELYDSAARRIYNHAYRLLGDWSAAEDTVSLTFLEAWRGRERIDATGDTLLPWLLGIATNVVRNTARARRRHAAALARLPRTPPEPDFVDELAEQEQWLAVRAALETLRRGGAGGRRALRLRRAGLRRHRRGARHPDRNRAVPVVAGPGPAASGDRPRDEEGDPMSDELAALLPPAPAERDVPAARRAALLRELTPARPAPRWSGWTAPALAAAALVLVVALTAVLGLVLRPEPRHAAQGGPTSLAELRARWSAAPRTALPGYSPTGFVYVRERTPEGAQRETWYSADGSRPGAERTSAGNQLVPGRSEAPPASGADLLALVEKHPTVERLRRAAAEISPERFVASLRERGRSPGEVFATLVDALRTGGQADPRVRTWLYDTALLIPGLRFVADAADDLGRHAPALALTDGDRDYRILINPHSGAFLGGGTLNTVPGKVDYTVLEYGATATAGELPAVLLRPDVVPLSALPDPAKSAVVPATVRDVDFRNGDWRLPLRVNGDGLSATPLVAEQLVAYFVDGKAVVGAVTLVIDPQRFPVRYLQPTPKQVGAADGPVPEVAIVVVEIRSARGATYAVYGFTGQPAPGFPGPAELVLYSRTPPGRPR
ncbi:hypothetical protein GCM10009539_22200 [Cryptosporangium japonicum]|uniref:RNA polymerase sigma-70 region 2 domain-containing protein n=1 Tax=Cryptosporangium japonicum TaxID=80872 RepID=A0ABN0U2E7_9ACTN